MAESPTLDESAILRTIRDWPCEQQIHLAHMILDPGLATLDPETGRPDVASAELRGIGKGEGPPPTDDEVERWRMEKYGE